MNLHEMIMQHTGEAALFQQWLAYLNILADQCYLKSLWSQSEHTALVVNAEQDRTVQDASKNKNQPGAVWLSVSLSQPLTINQVHSDSPEPRPFYCWKVVELGSKAEWSEKKAKLIIMYEWFWLLMIGLLSLFKSNTNQQRRPNFFTQEFNEGTQIQK